VYAGAAPHQQPSSRSAGLTPAPPVIHSGLAILVHCSGLAAIHQHALYIRPVNFTFKLQRSPLTKSGNPHMPLSEYRNPFETANSIILRLVAYEWEVWTRHVSTTVLSCFRISSSRCRRHPLTEAELLELVDLCKGEQVQPYLSRVPMFQWRKQEQEEATQERIVVILLCMTFTVIHWTSYETYSDCMMTWYTMTWLLQIADV
jgi:hypothetical protein